MKKLISLLSISLLFASITLVSSCDDEYGDEAAPIQWTSNTHSVKMANKYTHRVDIDANADTIQFSCTNYSYPYIVAFSDPDTIINYNGVGNSSYAEIPGKESYYFADTHEQHINRPTIKVELKENVLSVIIDKNTTSNQRIYGISFNDSEEGYPTLGNITIIQSANN